MTEETYDYSEIKQELNPKDNILASLSALALEQKRAEEAVAKATEALTKAQEELKEIAEKRIPELMDAAEMTKYTTRDGLSIAIKEKVHGSIPKATEDKAFAWLAEHGHDDLIKREFKIQFNKNEEAWAAKFKRDMDQRKKKLAYEIKRAVHPSTLSSFVSGQLEQGVEFPMDIFGVFRKRTAKIDID